MRTFIILLLLTAPAYGTEMSIVLVHGFLRSSRSMSTLAYSFKKEGWDVINWSYPSRQRYIEDHAEELIVSLNALSQRKPGKPINFVTHSMGGLIVRCALNHPDCPEEAKIGRAVLIAPPNRGSMFARYLQKYNVVRWLVGQKSGRQLLTTPIDGFDQLGKFPEYMPVMIISGTGGFNPVIPGRNDGKVGLKETCLTTSHFHETSSAGHSWICDSPDVVKKAKIFLGSPR